MYVSVLHIFSGRVHSSAQLLFSFTYVVAMRVLGALDQVYCCFYMHAGVTSVQHVGIE